MTMPSEGPSQSSIDYKQNAKGEYAVSPKIYQNADGTIDLALEGAELVTRAQSMMRSEGHKIVGDAA